ncbi:AAA family ATPase [Paenibacillus sp. FSL R7-0198]|uniref:AAA family ATPase n=1 Tax=Paenibacillus sp. FSL R7-0198 TaxID=2921674 RepID=UPI0030FBB952
MKLNHIYVEEYKLLKKFNISFQESANSPYRASCRFLIGQNGSGKSALLEVISLIFTRIMQDESPGFKFQIDYSIRLNGRETKISVWNLDGPLTYSINGDIQDMQISPFSDRQEYHPTKILAQSTGPNNMLDQVLLQTPEDALISDVYDYVSDPKREVEDATGLDRLLGKIERLYEDPRYLFINGETALYVIITLCVFSDISDDTNLNHIYSRKRKKLFDLIGDFTPVSFSLSGNNEKFVTGFGKESGSIEREFMKLLYSKQESGSLPLYDFLSRTLTQNNGAIKRSSLQLPTHHYRRNAIFRFDKNTNYTDFNYFHKNISNVTTPLSFLSSLIYAKRMGLLEHAELAFKLKGSKTIFTSENLSDGEYLWLAHLGILLLMSCEENILLLLDEPDVHLNESWNVNFIKYLNEFISLDNSVASHEVVIATHSSMILTDVDPQQLYQFRLISENKQLRSEIKSTRISSFGANLGEISKQIFGTGGIIGSYAEELIDEAFRLADEENNYDKLKQLQDMLGPGYHYFRVSNRLLELEEKD